VRRNDKEKEIENLRKDFTDARNVLLAGFQGLTVGQDTELRRAIRAVGSRYRVVKNTLAKRAAQGTALEPIKERFTGSSAVAYNAEDPVSLAKAITTYAKTHPRLVFKAGVVEGRVIDLADLNQIASLPSKEELISKLMFLLNAGAQRLAGVVQAVPRNLAVVMEQAGKEKKFAE
jgi:large subunit ribosomal protein L10